MISLCTDIGFKSLNKYGEQLCGDHIDVIEQGENSWVVVLADGLGSGVKASILSTLTSKIISTMMAKYMPIEECVATIAATLPVCGVRGLAYSTFTIISVVNNNMAEIIQYDNPHVILLRDGKSVDYAIDEMTIEGKTIYKSKFPIQVNDVFIAISDGAVHAGVGKTLNFGWERENIISYLEKIYDENMTSKTMSTLLLDKCNNLYGEMPGDDTSAAVIRLRKRTTVNLLIGPPENPKDLNKMLTLFLSKEGKRIVCGGTTSTLVAEHLGEEMEIELDYVDEDIPPTAKIKGVDLVTEGVLTINRVLTYAESYLKDNQYFVDWNFKEDGASRISRLLFEEASDINFFVGKAKNPAHQNPDLPISFSIKMRLVEELARCLGNMGKKIKVSYF